jgi:hypothetical protein
MPPLRAKIEFELNGLIEAGKLRQDSSGLFLKDP